MSLVVTERGDEVAVLVPSGRYAGEYARLAAQFGATVPVVRLEQVAATLETCSESSAAGWRFATTCSTKPIDSSAETG